MLKGKDFSMYTYMTVIYVTLVIKCVILNMFA